MFFWAIWLVPQSWNILQYSPSIHVCCSRHLHRTNIPALCPEPRFLVAFIHVGVVILGPIQFPLVDSESSLFSVHLESWSRNKLNLSHITCPDLVRLCLHYWLFEKPVFTVSNLKFLLLLGYWGTWTVHYYFQTTFWKQPKQSLYDRLRPRYPGGKVSRYSRWSRLNIYTSEYIVVSTVGYFTSHAIK